MTVQLFVTSNGSSINDVLKSLICTYNKYLHNPVMKMFQAYFTLMYNPKSARNPRSWVYCKSQQLD